MEASGGSAKRQTVYFEVARLIEQLKSELEEERLNAMNNVGHIAATLGADRTRDELLPYLNEGLGDDEDEIMKALAKQLGGFLELVGGAHHCSHILVPLEALCTMEEVDVRKQAVASIEQIANSVPESQIALNFFPLLRRLGRNEWFTSRVAACALIPVLYPRLSKQLQSDCQTLLAELAKDPTPMVRRAAMENLPAVIKAVDAKTLAHKVFPVFKDLSADDQDSVRRLAINSCIALASAETAGSDEEMRKEIIRCVQKLHSDVSWRIRWSVANSFYQLANSLGVEKLRQHLLSMYTSLLEDAEDEVRAAASLQVKNVSSLLTTKEIVEEIFPAIKLLSNDDNEHVRGALATVVMSVSPLIGKELTIDHLLPIFLKMLKDVNPDVQLNIISSLEDVNKVVGVSLLAKSLLPAIVELAEDKKWRVRLAIIEQIPILGKQLGEKFFDHRVRALFDDWLNDGFYQIREATAANLGILGGYFGTEWCHEYVLPMLASLKTNPCYLQRMTCLSAYSLLCDKNVGMDPVSSGILKDVIAMTKDKVPNVRFKAVKTLEALSKLVSQSTRAETIIQVLRRLKTDGDEDVVFYAKSALAACGTA
eukprot:INCI7126.1.p1 GENE.INCI7126.1~~INCI7126.1.p1  ORF type:complete len:595 (-),score=136.70 INCI7126.1:1473-3257(-)